MSRIRNQRWHRPARVLPRALSLAVFIGLYTGLSTGLCAGLAGCQKRTQSAPARPDPRGASATRSSSRAPGIHATTRRVDPADIQAPPGFQVEVVASGLGYLSDITFGPNGELYIAETGGHSYGTTVQEAPPPRILTLVDGQPRVIYDQAVPLEAIRSANTYADIPEGIISPITGITYNPRNGLLYISHRTRISTLDPDTGAFRTIVDGLPSWGMHPTTKVIFGPDGKMYFTQGTQSNLGAVDERFVKVLTAFDKTLARDVPCEDVTLRGIDFTVDDVFTPEAGDTAQTGVYMPFGVRTRPGELVRGQLACNGAFYQANPDGTGLRVLAWGLRANFGYRFSPGGRLIATHDGCDPIPPRKIFDDWDTIYEITPGAWYGWPDYCSGVPVTDERFRLPDDPTYRGAPETHQIVLSTQTRERLLEGRDAPPQPLAKLPSHSAVQGMVFGRAAFGMDPENDILVAEFGNILPLRRDLRPGYKVQRVNLETGQVSDFLVNEHGIGPASLQDSGGLERPITLEWGPDGALYVVDFGVIDVTEQGTRARPSTGVIWKVTRSP